MATFQELSYVGTNPVDRYLNYLEHVKFGVPFRDGDPVAVYHQNTDTHKHHYLFGDAVGLDLWAAERGEVVYHPHVQGPNGETGVFRYQFQPADELSFGRIAKIHELLAASMPFLRNNLVYSPIRPMACRPTNARRAATITPACRSYR